MYQYGLEPTFWLRLVVVISIFLLLLVSFNVIISRWLKMERKKLFSYNHVNEKHEKIDWIIRVIAILSILLGYFINSTRGPTNWYWFLQPWFILAIFIVVSEVFRAFMEHKYAENPNAYKVTICNMVFTLILFFTLVKTEFWGLI
ncbi:hypothetical protein CEH05_08110 [Halobacillus halophilus]|uniref:DUF4181 domain-containing protein n=1 Tax=Halobacillus halophilus (strain ATCC 35676 / DSM 2266 / JCM 20832 / KCTC 3685 / LMG 17431 / NBRC 102448 / NCIMB 2269) TaxID=866895 RepID=I0JLE6_HALH3|nr:DUF4181 domain-containing protein [Halobacillus halophilus]ASF39079.1 hypothetical protein CEH05_08110 [Halobacillus halophilus]CCG44966.1 conserved hypothetical protein [Halobacillus halophilus DSM 2266]